MGFALLAAVLAVGPATAANLNDFARCLTRAGATYYTADWCPHCRRQNAMFGSALRYVHAVDCTNGCSEVKSFPMWTFRDGSRHPGVASFDVLARKTQCAFGQSGGDDGEWRRPERAERERKQEQRLGEEHALRLVPLARAAVGRSRPRASRACVVRSPRHHVFVAPRPLYATHGVRTMSPRLQRTLRRSSALRRAARVSGAELR
jgi:hypothetical protein